MIYDELFPETIKISNDMDNMGDGYCDSPAQYVQHFIIGILYYNSLFVACLQNPTNGCYHFRLCENTGYLHNKRDDDFEYYLSDIKKNIRQGEEFAYENGTVLFANTIGFDFSKNFMAENAHKLI